MSTEITFTPAERHFLTRYLGAQTDEQLAGRCDALLHKAQQYEAYTTVRLMNWLQPQVQTLSAYKTLSQRFTDPFPPVVCEFGVNIGTDVRQLVLDGLPSDRIVVTDVVAGYWDLGLDFYGDRETLKAKTYFCDAAATLRQASPLDVLKEKVDACFSLLVLHVFNKQQAQNCLSRQFGILAPGGVCFGTTCGAPVSRVWPIRGTDRWLFSQEDLKQLLETVGFREVVVERTALPDRLAETHERRAQSEAKEEEVLVLSFRGVKQLPEWASC